MSYSKMERVVFFGWEYQEYLVVPRFSPMLTEIVKPTVFVLLCIMYYCVLFMFVKQSEKQHAIK